MLAASLALAGALWAQATSTGPVVGTPADNKPAGAVGAGKATAAGSATAPADREKVLNELWLRRIVDRGINDWEPQDLGLLGRIREAEALGAFDLLREKQGTLRGFTVEFGPDRATRKVWLTKEGYQRYIFLRSQSALKYFETKGTPAKFAFGLRSLAGKRLFDGTGTLTIEGEALYNLILRGQPAQWKEPNGTVRFNRRPPPEPAKKQGTP